MKRIIIIMLLMFIAVPSFAVIYDMSKPFIPTRADWLALEFADLENACNANREKEGISFSIRTDYGDEDNKICKKINLNAFVWNKDSLDDPAFKKNYDYRVDQIKTNIEYVLNYFEWTKGLTVEVEEHLY